MKLPKYKVLFSSVVKPVVSAEKDKYLAKASLEELKKFIPEIDLETNIDLLPVAFSACVVNRVNKNDDVIDTDTALAIYKSFINKPINVEHNRTAVIGVITTAGLSEFGSEKPLTEEEASKLNSPFNVTLGGVIWKSVNEKISEAIEEAADPNSDKFLSISASWELGFTDFEIVEIEGDSKNLEDGKLIKDEKEVEELSGKLKGFGGNGLASENKRIYRKIKNEFVLPMGIGFTETPAAEVKGVAVKSPETELETNDASKKLEENISQKIENTVKEDNTTVMKLNSIKDLTDELLKTVSASVVTEFIESELKKLNEQYVAEKQSKEKELQANQEALANLRTELEKAKKELEETSKTLGEIKAKQEEAQKRETFNLRMTALDEKYALGAEEREIISKKIQDMNDESFAAYEKELEVLLKDKNKALKQAQASVEPPAAPTKPDSQNAVDSAVANAQPTTPTPPATPTAEVTLREKYAKAFAISEFNIKI